MSGLPQVLVKRLLDLVLSTVATICLAPVAAVFAAAIRLSSPGPVFFRQRRMGRGGRPFELLKFRTMCVDAPDWRNADGSAYAAEDGPRVTPIGRWLRRTSLDELPQLWNVLLGDMSLVGPRPDQPDQLQFYTEEEKRKLLVKPGITGLAQISGRNRISWSERKALDLVYVERCSLRLDLEILWKTIPCVLCRRDIHTPAAALRR